MRGIPGDRPPLRSMEALLCHHPLEEEGEERQAGTAHADGVHRHPTLEQPGQRVLVDVVVNVRQGVAFIVVLPQERRHRPSVGVHWTPD